MTNEAADRLRAIHVYIREPADERYLADLDAALATERRKYEAFVQLAAAAVQSVTLDVREFLLGLKNYPIGDTAREAIDEFLASAAPPEPPLDVESRAWAYDAAINVVRSVHPDCRSLGTLTTMRDRLGGAAPERRERQP